MRSDDRCIYSSACPNHGVAAVSLGEIDSPIFPPLLSTMFGHTNDPFIFSPLEQSGPRVYARPIFCFPLGPSYDQDEVVRILKGGLAATKEQIPYLSAEVVPDPDAEQKGCLYLREGDFGELRVKTLDKSEFPLTYDEFRARNFPVDVLRDDVLCPVPSVPKAGDAVPVFVSQASFVEGGLLLSICIFHLVADGYSLSRVFQAWAQHCRKAQDKNSREDVFLSSSAFERAPLMVGHLSDPDKCNLDDYPEIVVTEQPPEHQVPATARPYRATVYRFTALALAQLRADASAGSAHKVSTDDALAALMWRCTLAAQLSADAAAALPDPTSILSVAVPCRSRTFPPLAPDYMGCPYIYAMPRAPAADLVAGKAELPSLARLVKAAVDAITPHYLSNVINMFQKVHDYACLKPACFDGLGGPHVFVSTWQKLPFYSTEWGDKLGGRCERLRTASHGMLNGLHMILPAVPKSSAPEGSEGVEVVMGFEDDKGEALKNDSLWMRYAVVA